jgi:hypothetical protein
MGFRDTAPLSGWVHDPQLTSPGELFYQSVPTNRFGFLYDNDGIFERQSDRFVIVVAGGSVAWQFAVLGRERLRARLPTHPLLKTVGSKLLAAPPSLIRAAGTRRRSSSPTRLNLRMR